MAKQETKKEVKVIMLPQGRVINHSLFAPDQYDEKAAPRYTVELAFDPALLMDRPKDGDSIEDELVFAGNEEWGDKFETLFEEGKTIAPFLDGNGLAAKREEKGKPGDAYKGKLVIRAATQFDKNGNQCKMGDTAGVHVYGPDAEPINAMNREELYQGCHGIAAVTIWNYTDERTGKKGQKFFLKAFQKTEDGEKLVTPSDPGKLFKPIGRAAGKAEGGSGRRRAA